MADLIDELSGMTDAALTTKLGLDKKVKGFKADLAKAAKLDGENRKKVLKTLENMFSPHEYAIHDLHYDLERIERKEKTGCHPAEITDCCCGPTTSCD